MLESHSCKDGLIVLLQSRSQILCLCTLSSGLSCLQFCFCGHGLCDFFLTTVVSVDTVFVAVLLQQLFLWTL